MNATPDGTSLHRVIVPGSTRDRRDRPVRNGRWYLATSTGIVSVGWGDLSMGDLDQVAAHLGPREMFLTLSEHISGGEDEVLLLWFAPSDQPTVAGLAVHATFVVTEGLIRVVDHYRRANRRGAIWISPGYRWTRSGRRIDTAKRRVVAITPDRLLDELDTLLRSPPSRTEHH